MCSFLVGVEGLMNEGPIEKSCRNTARRGERNDKICMPGSCANNPSTVSTQFVHVWLTNASRLYFQSSCRCVIESAVIAFMPVCSEKTDIALP